MNEKTRIPQVETAQALNENAESKTIFWFKNLNRVTIRMHDGTERLFEEVHHHLKD